MTIVLIKLKQVNYNLNSQIGSEVARLWIVSWWSIIDTDKCECIVSNGTADTWTVWCVSNIKSDCYRRLIDCACLTISEGILTPAIDELHIGIIWWYRWVLHWARYVDEISSKM